MTPFTDSTLTPTAAAPDLRQATSDTAPVASAAPVRASAAGRGRSATAMRLLAVVVAVGGTVLAGIGFYGSYNALVALGITKGFGSFAHVFPIGVDAGIVVLLAMDLYLTRRGASWPLLRAAAHILTVATIVFNAAASDKPMLHDPVGAGMHAVIPLMFVMTVEAARRLIIKAADLEAGRPPAGVPLHRWLLAPGSSFAMYRRMRLYGIDSYARAVELDRERVVYRVMLDRKHGSWRKAPSEARLPFTLAPYGLSVDEALAQPQQAAEAERLRTEKAEADALDAQVRAEKRAADAEIARIQSQGNVDTARHQVDAQTGVAQAQARAARIQAETAVQATQRAAAAEQEAEESATTAEARRRQAAADAAEAEDRQRAAEATQAAAEAAQRAAEAEQKTAEHNAAVVVAKAAEADAKQAVEKTRHRAAEAARAAAEAELRAVEAEDAARLTPKQRAVRKVARMILATGTTDPDRVELQRVMDALGVSQTTASERRSEAAALLDSGFRP